MTVISAYVDLFIGGSPGGNVHGRNVRIPSWDGRPVFTTQPRFISLFHILNSH